MNIEDDLRRTLRRTPAPPDFASRVLERIERRDGGGGEVERESAPQTAPPRHSAPLPFRRFDRPVVRWLAAAATVAVTITGAARYHSYQQAQQQAAEAERVRQEIRVALQITSEKLALVQRRMNESNR